MVTSHVGTITSLSPTATTSLPLLCTDWWLIILTQSKPETRNEELIRRFIVCCLGKLNNESLVEVSSQTKRKKKADSVYVTSIESKVALLLCIDLSRQIWNHQICNWIWCLYIKQKKKEAIEALRNMYVIAKDRKR